MNDYEAPPNQKLNTTSSPTFAGLTINGTATFASTVTVTTSIASPLYTSGAGAAIALSPGDNASATDTAGAALNLRSGKGRGAGAASSIVFQTPTVGSTGTTLQTLATRLTITEGSVYLGSGTAFGSASTLSIHGGGSAAVNVLSSTSFVFRSTIVVSWGSSTFSTPDVGLARLGAANLRLGLAPSATPVAQTFTIGEASRPGTDSNVGGAAATLRPGLGTGTGTAPKFAIQGVVLAGSGTDVQTYTDMIAVTGVALGFYGASPVAQQTGVAVSAAGVHAALVNLGLITA